MTAVSQPTAEFGDPPPTTCPADPQRVLIVDDSAVARAVIGRLIEASERWVVAGAVSTVAAALAFLADASVDVLLLDIHMPGQDGLTALPDLLAAAPGAKVVVVSSSAAAGVQALALGAADALTKPGPSYYTSAFGAELLASLDRLASPAAPAHRVPPEPPRIAPAGAVPARSAAQPRAEFDLVAIGASTGGIHALSAVLAELPASCRVPIIVTQHLPATFMPYFAAQIALIARRPCDVAADRMRVRPGRVVVAPGDAHLRCVALSDGGTGIRLDRSPQTSGCMPSVDPMLASLAAIHGERLLAVVLSGMGRDGAIGAAAVRQAGGSVVVQDSASSVVWGMPGAVAAADDQAAVLAPAAIGRVIAAGRCPR